MIHRIRCQREGENSFSFNFIFQKMTARFVHFFVVRDFSYSISFCFVLIICFRVVTSNHFFPQTSKHLKYDTWDMYPQPRKHLAPLNGHFFKRLCKLGFHSSKHNSVYLCKQACLWMGYGDQCKQPFLNELNGVLSCEMSLYDHPSLVDGF